MAVRTALDGLACPPYANKFTVVKLVLSFMQALSRVLSLSSVRGILNMREIMNGVRRSSFETFLEERKYAEPGEDREATKKSRLRPGKGVCQTASGCYEGDG
jgi:hypothetical protein